MTWLEVLYITIGGFRTEDSYETAKKTAESLNSKNGDERMDVIKDWLATYNMYDEEHISKMRDSITAPMSGLGGLYDKLSTVELKDDRVALYGSLIANMVASRGEFLSGKWEGGDDIESLDESDVNDFITEFNNLKNGDKSLDSLITFFYGNGLNNLDYEKMTGKKEPENSNPVAFIAYRLLPFMSALNNAKRYENAVKMTFYDAIEKLYNSDEDFIKAVSELVDEFITFSSGSFDGTALLKSIEFIRKNYPDDDNIAYKEFDDALDSKKTLTTEAKNIANYFSKAKFSEYNLRVAIREFLNYNRTGTSKVIKSDEMSTEFEQGIDKVLEYLLAGYSTTINTISTEITNYDSFLAAPMDINKKLRMSLNEVIPLWHDFVVSRKEYKYLGVPMNEAVAAKCDELLKIEKYEYNGVSVLNPKTQNRMLDILGGIVIDKPENRYESIMPYLSTKFNKADTSIITKINVQLQFMKYISDFFTKFPFNDKIELSAAEKMDRMYDAVCNLVYYRDKRIHESYVYEGLFFGSYAITEAESKVDYFKKLWKFIEDYFEKKKQKVDVVDYVKNVAELESADENNVTDSSTNVANKGILSDEEINKTKESAEELKNAVAALDGKPQQ